MGTLNENLIKYEDEDEGFQGDNESKKDCEMCLREEIDDCSVKETVNDPSNENVKFNTKKSIPKEAEMSKDLPKWLLGYTSNRLLQLLTKAPNNKHGWIIQVMLSALEPTVHLFGENQRYVL